MELIYWRPKDFATPAAYKDRCLDLLTEAYIAYRRCDSAQLNRLLDVQMQTSDFAWEDPVLTSYERNIELITGYIGLCYVAQGKHDDAYNLAGLTLLYQDLQDARYIARGEQPPPSAEVRCMIINILAEMKYQGTEHRDRVTTPEELCDLFPAMYDATVEKANVLYATDLQCIADVKEWIGWAWLQAIKSAARWCPTRVPAQVISFNLRYGNLLSRHEGEWRKPDWNPSHCWTVDFAIALSHIAGRLTARGLDMLTQQREALLSEEQQGHEIFRCAAEREYRILRSGCTLEVVERAS